MHSRCLIYLSPHQLTAFHWRAGMLTREGVFEATDAGKLEFIHYLGNHSKSVVTILANVAEEGFHIETIPFLRGADRRSIITRKLGQQFFNASLTTSVSLGHEKSRRRNERIMLAALTNNEALTPWLTALASAETALAGIYSLPLLSPLLLRKLGIVDERCLLLTIQDQSIRQTYVERGELHFSRFTHLANNSMDSIAQTFSSEARKLQQYLVSQRLLGRQQPIRAYILVHANARTAVESRCVNSETLSFAILDIEDCARICHLKTLPVDTRCETLLLHLLATDPPRTQFASAQQRHYYHLWLVRAVLRNMSAVVLLGCLLWSGKQFYDAYRLSREAEMIRAETALAHQRYDHIISTFPSIPTTTETLRRVIDRYAELIKGNTSPAYLLRDISQALQADSSVELDSIEWKVAVQAPQEAVTAGAQRTPSVDSEIAVVRGTLRPGPDSHPRQILAVFNRLLDALKHHPKLQVEVLQQPFDVESGKSLKGGDAAVDDLQPRVFKLQIRRTID